MKKLITEEITYEEDKTFKYNFLSVNRKRNIEMENVLQNLWMKPSNNIMLKKWPTKVSGDDLKASVKMPL